MGEEKLKPRTFEAGGHRWVLELNAWTLKRVRTLAGVEINKWTGKDTIDRMIELFGDPILFVDVLYVLCEEQCKERGITDERFGRSMRADSIEQAAEAFWGAFADFCRSQGREAMLLILEKMKQFSDRATTLALTEVRKLDVETMVQSLTSRLSATSSPASSESIPAG